MINTSSINGGTVASAAITGGTVTNATITGGSESNLTISAATVTNSNINSTPIGSSVASTGNFTTLGANSLSVTGKATSATTVDADANTTLTTKDYVDANSRDILNAQPFIMYNSSTLTNAKQLAALPGLTVNAATVSLNRGYSNTWTADQSFDGSGNGITVANNAQVGGTISANKGIFSADNATTVDIAHTGTNGGTAALNITTSEPDNVNSIRSTGSVMMQDAIGQSAPINWIDGNSLASWAGLFIDIHNTANSGYGIFSVMEGTGNAGYFWNMNAAPLYPSVDVLSDNGDALKAVSNNPNKYSLIVGDPINPSGSAQFNSPAIFNSSITGTDATFTGQAYSAQTQNSDPLNTLTTKYYVDSHIPILAVKPELTLTSNTLFGINFNNSNLWLASQSFSSIAVTGKATSASTVPTDPYNTLATKDYIDIYAVDLLNQQPFLMYSSSTLTNAKQLTAGAGLTVNTSTVSLNTNNANNWTASQTFTSNNTLVSSIYAKNTNGGTALYVESNGSNEAAYIASSNIDKPALNVFGTTTAQGDLTLTGNQYLYGNFEVTGSTSLQSTTITGGNIDNTVIGSITPNTGNFTNITANKGTITNSNQNENALFVNSTNNITSGGTAIQAASNGSNPTVSVTNNNWQNGGMAIDATGDIHSQGNLSITDGSGIGNQGNLWVDYNAIIANNLDVFGKATSSSTDVADPGITLTTKDYVDTQLNGLFSNSHTWTADQTFNSAHINGGAINGTPIGNTSASTGNFTNLTASNGTITNLNNTTIGNTSAAAASFTNVKANNVDVAQNLTASAGTITNLNNTTIGNTAPMAAWFTNAQATNANVTNNLTASAGTITNLNNSTIGNTSAAAASFTNINANNVDVAQNLTASAGTITNLNNTTIGNTAPMAAWFTNAQATNA
ncbi:MAG: hypothetical protein NT007_15700, partial [Candidatus Kapabacteria bacterium]|nr:hypothetical protein [Candidatus Kapabacteria bacterium]